MEKKLRSATYEAARKICDEVGLQLNMNYDDDAKDLIAELVWKKLAYYGNDLEAFMKHGKRSTITVDDVKLLVRRNNSLKHFIEEKAKGIASNKTETASRGKKRKGSETTSTASTSDVVTLD